MVRGTHRRAGGASRALEGRAGGASTAPRAWPCLRFARRASASRSWRRRPRTSTVAARRCPAWPRREPLTRPRTHPQRDLEDFLGGSVLAWLGGVAVLAGLAFLLRSRSPAAGSAKARARRSPPRSRSACSARHLAARAARQERSRAGRGRGRDRGSFGTLFVAGPVYHLVPRRSRCRRVRHRRPRDGLGIRWHAQVMGWLGLLGAIWAPSVLGGFAGGGRSSCRSRSPRDHRARPSAGPCSACFAYFSATLQWARGCFPTHTVGP